MRRGEAAGALPNPARDAPGCGARPRGPRSRHPKNKALFTRRVYRLVPLLGQYLSFSPAGPCPAKYTQKALRASPAKRKHPF